MLVKRTHTLFQCLLILLGSVASIAVHAQSKFWVGGSGDWNDGTHWSSTQNGPGGAGVPRVNEDVVITSTTVTSITLRNTSWCKSLSMDGNAAPVRMVGSAAADMNIAGGWSMQGDVAWNATGPINLVVRHEGVELDLRGRPIAADILFNGNGSWSVISDLKTTGDLRLQQGTLIGNQARIDARELRVEGRGQKEFLAGNAMVFLRSIPDASALNGVLRPAGSFLVVQDEVRSWGVDAPSDGEVDRDINVCGTGPGQIPFTVNAQLISNFNGFGVRCRGECNATVTVSASGGSNNFTYSWLFGGPPSMTWTTACGGPQLVVVTDVGQGISCPAQVNVTEPGPVGVIFFGQGTPPSCAGVCDGTRTALAIGGVSPHTYSWNNGAGTNSSFNALCAGSNTLRITDANNCIFDTTFVFNLAPIAPNLTFTNAGCFGECDGTATVAPTGGTGTLTATWGPGTITGQGTFSATELCAGDYSVTLADANGCDTTLTFTIAEPPPILVSVTTTPASCSGSCDGTVDIVPSGGVGPYGFLWSPEPGTGQGTANVTGLCAGFYTVLVTDQPTGCDTLISIIIDAPPAFMVQGAVTDATCSNTCDGEITLTVSGGSPGYTFLWVPTPPSGQGSPTITGLCPGPYDVTVTDIAGCDTTVNFVVNAPPPIAVALTTTDVTCTGVCDGTAMADVSGGVPNYTYLWSPSPGAGQGTANVTGLCAGPHTLLVTDNNGCDTTLNFTILEPLPLTATPSQTDVTCGTLCDGTASVVVAGGTPDYTYLWSPGSPTGQGTASVSDLCAGNYQVLITDNNGCTLTQVFTILEAAPILISLQMTPASCPGVCDGTAGVIASGGAGGFIYLWAPQPGAGQGTANVTGLCPQAYSLTVTDAVGCDTTISFTITAPPPIEPNATVNDATCAGDCNGSIDLAPTGGSGVFSYNWEPAPPVGQGTANASGLCAGDWMVTITSGACDTTITLTVNEPPPIIASIATTDASCAGVCDGTATATVSGGVPGYTFLWSPAPGGGQGTTDATELCAGPYTLLITDANGCDTTLNFTILEPPPLQVTPSQTDLTCSGTCDGTASVLVSGGSPGYTYLWSPGSPNGQGTPSVTDLCIGDYAVLITDLSGCTITQQFTIGDEVPITLSLQLTPASCSNVCDGAAGVIAGGGLPNYIYFWDPAPGAGQGTASVTGLCPQAYSLTVSDAAGCDTTVSFTITSPPPILSNATQTDVTCAGECNGTILTAPTGGNGTYTYNWVPQPQFGQGTPNAGGLCAGDWSLTITSGGCDTTITFTILEPLQLEPTLETTDVSCAGDCNGTCSIPVITGGTAPYAFLWAPAPGSGQGTPNVTDLCAGVYTVTVSDAAGCDTTLTFEILAPPPILPGLVTTPETCAGPCTGTATVAPLGGTGPIIANWQPAPGGGQGTFQAIGLCSNVAYEVTLTDANGCDTTLAFTILPSADILPNSSSTPTSCNGTCDGTATVGPTGGVEPYTYLWSPPPTTGQNTPTASGFCAGPVQVTITDATGCSIVAQVLITEPPPLIASAELTNPPCAGICDGSVVLTTTGGQGALTFQWSPQPPAGQGTNTITGLCAGTWNVVVTDALGCSSTGSYNTVEPAPLTLTVATTPSQCQVCIGTATATFGGGTGSVGIEWTNALNVVVGSTETLNGLCAGLYTATLTDDNGCSLQRTVLITDSDGEEIVTVDGITSCPNTCDGMVSVAFNCVDGPCTIAWTDAMGNDLGNSTNTVSGLCPGDYYVSVTNASGCVTIDTAVVDVPVTVTLNVSSSPVSCSGECDGSATVGIVGGTPAFTFTWVPEPFAGQGTPSVSGLCAMVYELSVEDGAGCITTQEVLITEPAPLALFNSIVIGTACAGVCDGNITLLVTGGTGNYDYQWTPAPAAGQGSSAAFGFCAGNVSVLITDDNGCTLARTFVITEPAPLQASATSTPSSCPNCDGTGSITVQGGTQPYTFSWLVGGVEVSTDQAPVGLCGGVYSVTVRDAFGCFVQLVVPVPDGSAEVLETMDGMKLCSSACDAVVSVSFNCSVDPCTIEWTDADGNVLAQDVTTLTNLCEGVYTVQVTNGSGCVALATASVSPSITLVPNISSSPVSCNGVCDGSATVGPFGGIEPYTFVWSPEPIVGQGTPQVTELCAGVYEVLISDSIGCDTTVSVLILEPTPIVLDAVVTNVACNATCTGSIIVAPSGGAGGYSFVWTPAPPNGQGSNGAFDLCPGDYEVVVTDGSGCFVTRSWTISEPPALVLSGGSIPSECGQCDGESFVEAVGGTDPYTYLWTTTAGVFGTTDSLQGLCAGLYTVLVTDALGCSASLLVPVQDRNGEVTTTVDDTTSCPGICDGSVQVVLNCGTPACTVAWYDAAGNDLFVDTEVLSPVCAGDYLVLVTNGIGCITVDTAHVSEPDPIIPNLSTTPVTCFGDCDGTATVGPTGGFAPYTFNWDPEPGVGQGTPQAEGLCAGTATVTITDDAGCTLEVPVLILGPELLTADVQVLPITCNGACDGSIVVTPQGGNGGYTFNWTPEPPNGQGNNAALDLCAGDWTVQITDVNGCDTTITITLTDPPLLEVQLTTTDNACFGDCIGTATAVITGGVEPYTIIWTDGFGDTIALDTTMIGGLCVGNYVLNTTDANGCTVALPFAITENTAIDAALVFLGETCNGPCDGMASVSPSGGVGPYTIVWGPEPINGQGDEQITGLCAGNYTVTITDQLGCDTTYAFTLLPYAPIVDDPQVTDVQCNGACDGTVVTNVVGGIGTLDFVWSPEPGTGQGSGSAAELCPDAYTLTVTDAVGCDSVFMYTITEPNILALTIDLNTPASCTNAEDGALGVTVFGGTPNYTFEWSGPGGFTAVTEDIAQLDPGVYVLTVTDLNGCTVDTTVTVDALITVVADAGADQVACIGTEATLDGSNSTGAVTYSWTDDQGNVIGIRPTVTIPTGAAGDAVYTLTVTDGPCSSTDQITVTTLALPIANAGLDHTIFLSETVTLGGAPTGPIGSTFTWQPDTLVSNSTAANPTTSPSVTTWFGLTVVGPNGCVDTDSVLVTVVPTVVIPTGFTPNSDGRNDAWVIDFIDLFPNCEVEVYNRWGDQLFRSVGYKQPWDGKYRDGYVPVGTYYYVIELNDERFSEPYTGPLTVIR
ncbi:MAG: gliding motility-associated C-terminal domain-containing protein [Flavobacteriales bacterium]|nr:gliding motility-associated C-terminal domain-containing protein [Flavobacteriales bacterium]